MEYEEGISHNMSMIPFYEVHLIEFEQVLGRRGESSIIRYY